MSQHCIGSHGRRPHCSKVEGMRCQLAVLRLHICFSAPSFNRVLWRWGQKLQCAPPLSFHKAGVLNSQGKVTHCCCHGSPTGDAPIWGPSLPVISGCVRSRFPVLLRKGAVVNIVFIIQHTLLIFFSSQQHIFSSPDMFISPFSFVLFHLKQFISSCLAAVVLLWTNHSCCKLGFLNCSVSLASNSVSADITEQLSPFTLYYGCLY